MIGIGVCPNWTRVAAGQTDSAIAAEGSIVVFAIHIAATSAGIVTIEEGDGSTVIMTFDMAAGTCFGFETPFLATRGINVTTPAGVTCTVFHSNAGA